MFFFLSLEQATQSQAKIRKHNTLQESVKSFSKLKIVKITWAKMLQKYNNNAISEGIKG